MSQGFKEECIGYICAHLKPVTFVGGQVLISNRNSLVTEECLKARRPKFFIYIQAKNAFRSLAECVPPSHHVIMTTWLVSLAPEILPENISPKTLLWSCRSSFPTASTEEICTWLLMVLFECILRLWLEQLLRCLILSRLLCPARKSPSKSKKENSCSKWYFALSCTMFCLLEDSRLCLISFVIYFDHCCLLQSALKRFQSRDLSRIHQAVELWDGTGEDGENLTDGPETTGNEEDRGWHECKHGEFFGELALFPQDKPRSHAHEFLLH